MKVASKKPETKVMDEQTVQMEMQRKKIDKITKCILFDFECTQYTGVHVPNLCCVQIVCEMCAEAGVDAALCKRCGDEKHMVFRGGGGTRVKMMFPDGYFAQSQTKTL